MVLVPPYGGYPPSPTPEAAAAALSRAPLCLPPTSCPGWISPVLLCLSVAEALRLERTSRRWSGSGVGAWTRAVVWRRSEVGTRHRREGRGPGRGFFAGRWRCRGPGRRWRGGSRRRRGPGTRLVRAATRILGRANPRYQWLSAADHVWEGLAGTAGIELRCEGPLRRAKCLSSSARR